jgi:hypothetical protein
MERKLIAGLNTPQDAGKIPPFSLLFRMAPFVNVTRCCYEAAIRVSASNKLKAAPMGRDNVKSQDCQRAAQQMQSTLGAITSNEKNPQGHAGRYAGDG